MVISDTDSKMPSLSNPLQQAVFRGCVECIGVLVETPPYYSVDACCGPDGLRPIHIAAREGHISSLRYLAAAGACLLKSDANGSTALHHAAIGGQLRAVRWLLRHGAKITLDKRGRSPIQVAADHDHMEIVSLLAKHASSVTSSSCLTLSSSTSHSSKSSPSTTTTIAARNHHPNHNKNSSKQLYGQSLQENHINNNHNNNHNNTSTSHTLGVSSSCGNGNVSGGDDPKVSPTCAADSSSSGNSSLATTSGSNSPSLSPSATCSCSSSSETSEKSVTSSGAEEENYSSKTSTTGSTSAQSVASFFLHPPKSSISSKIGNQQQNSLQHKRQSSQAPPPPFYLHLPLPPSGHHQNGDSNNNNPPNNFLLHPHHKTSVHFAESDVEIHALENNIMAPVTPVSANDFMSCKDKQGQQDDQQKPPLVRTCGVSGDTDNNNTCGASSSSSSPSPPPPQPKTVRLQSPDPGTENLQISNSVKNNSSNGSVQILIKGSNNSRPPPPPPPMPKFEEPFQLKHKDNSATPNTPNTPKMIPQDQQQQLQSQEEKPCYIYNGEENDYEDIDDMHDHMTHNNTNNNHSSAQEQGTTNSGMNGGGEHFLTKLNRTVSAPAGPTKSDYNVVEVEKVSESESSKVTPIPPKGIVPGIIHGMSGKVRVPFIPPNFPDPPKDALIKPSEYLKSIQKPQNKTKYGVTTGPKYGCLLSSNNSNGKTAPPRVEDAIRILGNGESSNHGGGMPAVSEETNMEDEFEEINPERINGNHVENGNGNKSSTKIMNGNHGHINGGCVRSEQLMKVNLRKTPMTRTNSAPPLGLGRVLPDIPSDQNSDQVKKSNEMNSPNQNHSPLNVNVNIQNVQMATISRASVIAELSESSQLGGIREWKDELRRRQSEQEKAAEKEMAQYYSPLNFVAEIPSTDGTGVPIPPWKRQMLAKKAAEKARKEAEEQRKIEAEAKRTAAIPPWRRQLLQRRESDGKYAQ